MKCSNKNIAKKISFLCLIVMMSMSISCTKKMEGLNKNLKDVTSQDLTIDANEGSVFLPDMITNIISPTNYIYQLQQNLGQDIYAGYLMTPTPFVGNVNNVTYSFIDGWVNTIWTVPSGVLNDWLKMKKRGYDKKYPDLYGIALICKVFAASRAADAFGPIPYSKYGESSMVAFDSEKEAYYAFFDDLKQAVQLLAEAEDKDPTADQFRFKKVDKSLFGGDYAEWIKTANTLRLRLAIRVSLVDPAKAQSEAEAAVNQKFGVLESEDGSFSITPPQAHPLATIANAWGDIRIGAPLETILKGYNDPRLPLYATPAIDKTVSGKIKGIRQGIKIVAKATYEGFSKPLIEPTTPIKIMDVAESYFLRAEGALRGWNMGGSAKQFYEDGVKASFKEYGLSTSAANAYLADNTSTQIAYIDPKNQANNAPALNFVTIKWDPGASFQKKLAKVITQKWIAMYPEGCEAWAEFRRTGYPHLYPVLVNNSGGKIPDGKFIKRFPYSTTFTNSSKEQVDAAVNKYLDGKDSPFTALWWDVN